MQTHILAMLDDDAKLEWQTIEAWHLTLKYDEVPESAKFWAHKSPAACDWFRKVGLHASTTGEPTLPDTPGPDADEPPARKRQSYTPRALTTPQKAALRAAALDSGSEDE